MAVVRAAVTDANSGSGSSVDVRRVVKKWRKRDGGRRTGFWVGMVIDCGGGVSVAAQPRLLGGCGGRRRGGSAAALLKHPRNHPLILTNKNME